MSDNNYFGSGKAGYNYGKGDAPAGGFTQYPQKGGNYGQKGAGRGSSAVPNASSPWIT